MSKVTKLPVTDQVRKEAVAWIIRLDQKDRLSNADKAELQEWMSKSPVHYRELQTANQFWANNILTELAVPLSYQQVDTERDDETRSSYTEKSKRRYRFAALLGWGGALTLAAILLVVFLPLASTSIKNTNGLYVTAVGQQSTLELADGSVLELNTNSQVDIKFSDDFRNIRLLQGEVHFSVAHDPEKPFRVYAAGNRVQAVGTAFSLQIADQSLSVVVTEGRVGLAALSRKASRQDDRLKMTVDNFSSSYETELGILNAKESIVLTEHGPSEGEPDRLQKNILTMSDDELYRRTSWRDGLLIFQGETLEEAVKEISRYTTITIDISDPEVKNIQVGGRFQVGDIDALLSALETNFNLKADYAAYNRVQLTFLR